MKKILIVEDEIDLVNCYRDLLSGYEIKHTIDRQEFESLIDTVDLVISDYNFSTVFKFDDVKQITESKSKPLILCSGIDETRYDIQIQKIEISKKLKRAVETLLKATG